MNNVTEIQAYENLANAIIIQAIKDYESPRYRSSIRKFFRSEWFEVLTKIHPDYIIKLCEKRVQEKNHQIYMSKGGKI